MQAILCREWGPPETLRLEEVAPPELTPEGVRIRIEAAGINFADLLMVAGKYQVKPPFPFSPGIEIAGTVLETGAAAQGFAEGQRVMAVLGHGGFAEEAVAPARAVFPIPDRLDFATAAGFPVAYGTSHGALAWRAALQPGETLLVHGAAGGVGLTAVEIGKAMGARVIATASSKEKLALAAAHGADDGICTGDEDVRARVKELTNGKGADVVYDPVGGALFDASLRAIAWGGRLLIIGFASGDVPQIPANLLLVKNVAAHGYAWGTYLTHAPERAREGMATLLRWWEEGKLRPHLSETLPLEAAADALNLLKTRRATGKVVLKVAAK